ncbi:MAG: type II toxin-antitoxin system VapC family toxin [Cyanobacteria bacterium J06643_4]
MAQYSLSDFSVSTVSFHEQMLGIHAYINRTQDISNTARGYEMMKRLVSDFRALPLVSFNSSAGVAYKRINPQKNKIAKMDARIAAIAIAHELILLTRNHKDFSKVIGLEIEDWTS